METPIEENKTNLTKKEILSYLEDLNDPSEKDEKRFSADLVIQAYIEGYQKGKIAKSSDNMKTLKNNINSALNNVVRFKKLLKEKEGISAKNLFFKILGLDLFELLIITDGEVNMDKRINISVIAEEYSEFIRNEYPFRMNITYMENDENINFTSLKDDEYYRLI